MPCHSGLYRKYKNSSFVVVSSVNVLSLFSLQDFPYHAIPGNASHLSLGMLLSLKIRVLGLPVKVNRNIRASLWCSIRCQNVLYAETSK